MATTVVPWVTPSTALAGTAGALPVRRSSSAKLGPGSSPGAKRGKVIAGRGYRRPGLRRSFVALTTSGVSNATKTNSLAPFLYVRAHEVLGVGIQDLVDLVQEVVDLGLDLLALLARGRRFLHLLLGPRGSG